MLVATASMLACYDEVIVALTEGSTRVSLDHELVTRYPLAWAASDSADTATKQAHATLICERITGP